jgi:predicted  nucleic acid-binding Zn-ribbon protein
MSGNVEEALKAALERLQSLEERVESLRRRYRSLKRRSRQALSKLRDAIAEFEADGCGSPHVEAGLEILYDVERLLEVEEE